MNTQILRCLAFATALVVSSSSGACTGRVVGISDGDTIKVMCEGLETKVRLDQVDAPEKAQAFGSKAKQVLSDLIFGKVVRLEISGTDRYGRTLATVWLADRDINRELIRAGYAWAYLKYLRDESLSKEEGQARSTQRGLWADSDPQPPWEFRREKRASSRAKSVPAGE